MPRTKTSIPSNAQHACALVPTESPVPGVNIELAILLVQAVKAHRTFHSKSSSKTEDDDSERESLLRRDLLRNLRDAADDKSAAFLNELKRLVQNKSSWSTSASSSRRGGGTNSTPADAPVRCAEFLLEILSNGSNSFHLRRSALGLTREILERSSGARAFLACGRCLLNFARMVEGVENDQVGEDDHTGGAYRGRSELSPKSLFQLEAMELIHDLASKFGNFYTQFTVASRLLGDVSINFSLHHIIRDAANNSDGAQNGGSTVIQSQCASMRILRRERNTALECGPKACQILEGMVERADEYFRVLVPRFGGFNGESLEKLAADGKIADISATYDSKLAASTDGFASNGNKDGGVNYDEDDDDSSIDWEDGDFVSPENENSNAGTNPLFADINDDDSINDHSLIDHHDAVTHTLEVMERSGALLEGTLAIQVRGGKSIEVGPMGNPATDKDQAHVEEVISRRKLQNLVGKVSRRLPRLNRWISALSHADRMEERTVVDPITSRSLVSLGLLSEGKRAARFKLLQRMMKVRGEIEGVLRSSTKLGISLEESGTNTRALGKEGDTARVNGVGHFTVTGVKRGSDTLTVLNKTKKSITSRFNVIYRKT